MNRIELLGILPYGLFKDSLGGSIYITDVSDYMIGIGNSMHVYKHLQTFVTDEFNGKITYNDKPIKHTEMFAIIESYIKGYIRTKKLERLCSDTEK